MITGVARRSGFALPTILIASVVMMIVLLSAVTATASVRSAILVQQYERMAQLAGEAGAAYAQSCVQYAQSAGIPASSLWNDSKPLKPTTDCFGNDRFDTISGDLLVVAGGGGGGGNCNSCGGAGGGGAGGLVYSPSYGLSIGSYSVTVGTGGAGGAASNSTTGRGTNGLNSVFDSITAIGGGGGRPQNAEAGATGGSGGAGAGGSDPVSGSGGAGTAGQGNNGGSGIPNNGGGGGGAGGVGATGSTMTGGVGLANSITGSSIFYAGGGGGGSYSSATSGTGGNGGGGNGGRYNLNSGNGFGGTANTGGGGGGASGATSGGTGGIGGSGVVIISYTTGAITATGGTITTSGGKTIHRFTSSGTFAITAKTSSICPQDPRCAVAIDGNARSSFSIGSPTLDADGNVLTIPQSGYVDILRSSNSAVWRTYRQPQVQPLVSSNLCGGATTNALGWTQAILHTTATKMLSGSAAQPITSNNGPAYAGPQYYRKDFTIPETANYTITAAADSQGTIFIDGLLMMTVSSTPVSNTVSLSAGCHTLYVQNYNNTVASNNTTIELSLAKSGSSVPLVKTDNTWRVSRGELKHFSQVGYYQDPVSWSAARDQGAITTSPWTTLPTDWPDMGARWIGTVHSYTAGAYPAASYSYYTPASPAALTMTNTGDYTVSIACDDTCRVFVDGNEVITCSGTWAVTCNITVTLAEGKHQMGVELYNGGASANNSGFLFSVIQRSTGRTILHSDDSWLAANSWYTSKQPLYSYDAQYLPNPRMSTPAPANILVVGGGGGGARTGSGGGAGGYLYRTGYSLYSGVYRVAVGGGGAAGTTTGVSTYPGARGSNSLFNDLIAEGGGGGTTHTNTAIVVGNPGGSGGGAPIDTLAAHVGGFGSQGNNGGGVPLIAGWSGGSGGGGGAGAVGAAGCNLTGCGAGGIGLANSISGASVYYAGGGGAGEVNGSFVGAGGNGGGGSGVYDSTGTSATANTGGGGGGGSYNGSAYFNGGAGGSGIVIISYPTGSLTATGGNTITTSGGNTIHKFTSSGTFTVTSIP